MIPVSSRNCTRVGTTPTVVSKYEITNGNDMKLLQELLQVNEIAAQLSGYADALKKHGFTKKGGTWVGPSKEFGKVQLDKNGHWKLLAATVDGFRDDYEGSTVASLEKHLGLCEGKVKTAWVPKQDDPEYALLQKMKKVLKQKHGFSDEDLADMSFADVESEYLDADEPNLREAAEKAWFSHDRKAWEKAVAELDVDDDGKDFAKLDGKLIAKWYEDRDEGWVLTESKNHLGETEYSSYASWKVALKKRFPDYWIDGDKEIANAMVGPQPYKRGETKSVGEWDGETGVIYK